MDIMNGPLEPVNSFGCVAVFSMRTRGVRANHYHSDKNERATLIEGECKLVLEHVKTKQREELRITAREPTLVTIPPYVAHAYVNTGKTPFTAIFYGERPHKEGNPKTIPYKVYPSK